MNDKLATAIDRITLAIEEQNCINRQLIAVMETTNATLERFQAQPQHPERATIAEAATVLGVKEGAIRDRISSTYYRQGKEVFDVSLPDAKQAAWRLDVNACLARDGELQKKRRKS